MKRLALIPATMSLALLLAACGGGGGDYTIFRVTFESILDTHTVGGTSCPQDLADGTVINDSDQEVLVSAVSGDDAIDVNLAGSTIAAKGNVAVAVQFDCSKQTSIDTSITFNIYDQTENLLETIVVPVDLTIAAAAPSP